MTQGINFGFLTIGGKQIKFEEFDKDGNGEISAQEYQQTLQELGISEDTVEFSSVDKNKDKKISGEEFVIMDQRIKMEETLTKFIQNTVNIEISDICQRRDITYLLQNYLEDFIEAYGTKNLDKMSTKFTESLSAKYEEIKADVVGEPKDRGDGNYIEQYRDEINEAADVVTEEWNGRLSLNPTQYDNLYETLVKKAEIYVTWTKNSNPDANITQKSIETWLNTWLSKSDKDLMQNNIDSWNAKLEEIGDYCSTKDFEDLKKEAKKFLTALLSNGITFGIEKIQMITCENDIDNLLDRFDASTAWSLQNLIKRICDTLTKNPAHTARFENNNVIDKGIWIDKTYNNKYLHLDNLTSTHVDWQGLENDEQAVTIINEVLDVLYKKYKDLAPDNTSSYWIGVMGEFLEKEAVRLMKANITNQNYDKLQLLDDLKAIMEQVDRDVINGENNLIDNWKEAINVGHNVSSEELVKLKNIAKEIIERIFEKFGNIIFDLNGNKITKDDLSKKIDSYTTANGKELIGLINTIINGLSDEPKYMNMLKGKYDNKITLNLDKNYEGTTIIESEQLDDNNEITVDTNSLNLNNLRKQLHDSLHEWAKSYVEAYQLSYTIIDTAFHFESTFSSIWDSAYNKYVQVDYSNNGLPSWDEDFDETYTYTYNKEALTNEVDTNVKNRVIAFTQEFKETQNAFNPETADLKGTLSPVYGIANGVKGFDKATEKLKEGAQGLAWNLYKNAVAAGCDSARASRAMSSLKAFYIQAMKQANSSVGNWETTKDFKSPKVTGSFTNFTDENGNSWSCTGSTVRSSNWNSDVSDFGKLEKTKSDSGLYIGCERDKNEFYIKILRDTAIEWFKRFLG